MKSWCPNQASDFRVHSASLERVKELGNIRLVAPRMGLPQFYSAANSALDSLTFDKAVADVAFDAKSGYLRKYVQDGPLDDPIPDFGNTDHAI